MKVEEVAIVVLPWPNRTSELVRFWSAITGVVPPVDVIEPDPVTLVTKLFGKLKVKVEPAAVICQVELLELVAKVKDEPLIVAPAIKLTEVKSPQLEIYNEPEEVTQRLPALKEFIVVDPEEVFKLTFPEMDKAVALAVVKVLCPVTKRGPESLNAVDDAVVNVVWPEVEAAPVTHKLLDRLKAVPEATPKIGVIKVGEVCKTLKPLPVIPSTYKAPAAVENTLPALKDESVVEPFAPTVK